MPAPEPDPGGTDPAGPAGTHDAQATETSEENR
jgi:hypothetical protein